MTTAYCSSENTGSNDKTQASIYQSQGLCSTYCSGYAFGILSGKQCWCSNYAPGDTTDSSDCSDACPGYPSDTCGNADNDLYEYLDLGGIPSGTIGATSSTAAATSSTPAVSAFLCTLFALLLWKSTAASSAVCFDMFGLQVTVTDTPPPVTVYVTTTPSVVASSSTSSSSSSITVSSTTTTATQESTTAAADTTTKSSHTPTTVSASSTTSTNAKSTSSSSTSTTFDPTPIVSYKTISGGAVQTVYITPTSAAASATLTANEKSDDKSGLSAGAAAGLAVGLLALAAIVGGICFFFWSKRKQQRAASEYGDISRQGSTLVKSSANTPSRTMSENSRYVLATDGRSVYPAWETDDEPGARASRLVPIDPRLDPAAAIYQQSSAARRSCDSINTINDGRDYSRRVAAKPALRVMNGDPDS